MLIGIGPPFISGFKKPIYSRQTVRIRMTP